MIANGLPEPTKGASQYECTPRKIRGVLQHCDLYEGSEGTGEGDAENGEGSKTVPAYPNGPKTKNMQRLL